VQANFLFYTCHTLYIHRSYKTTDWHKLPPTMCTFYKSVQRTYKMYKLLGLIPLEQTFIIWKFPNNLQGLVASVRTLLPLLSRTIHQTCQCNIGGVHLKLHVTHIVSMPPKTILNYINDNWDPLVVRVPGYRSRGPGFDSRALQDFFLRSSGSGKGSTWPCEYNWGAAW
jgi:hypothetical protein